MPAKVPITAMGSASDGMMVAETRRRKTKITPTTSAPAISSVVCTSEMELRIVDALVVHHFQLDRRRQAFLEVRQHGLDRVDHARSCWSRAGADRDADGALALVPAAAIGIFHAVDARATSFSRTGAPLR